MTALPTTRERPILFSGRLVRAIIEGRKTMTRRVVKPQPECGRLVPGVDSFGGEPAYWLPFELPGLRPEIGVRDKIRCPYGRPGDLLWVMETWRTLGSARPGAVVEVQYRAKRAPWASNPWVWVVSFEVVK